MGLDFSLVLYLPSNIFPRIEKSMLVNLIFKRFVFAMVVIPTCNLLSMSLVLAWMNGGLQEVIVLILNIARDTEGLANQILMELQRLPI